MRVDVSILIAVIGCALSVGTFFVGRFTAAKNSGKQDGVILTEIGYLKSGVDDIKRQITEEDRRHNELAGRVYKVEESAKQAHKRIDELIAMHRD
mgnify:CR=1 FL=1